MLGFRTKTSAITTTPTTTLMIQKVFTVVVRPA
jgi:hypothetical protein